MRFRSSPGNKSFGVVDDDFRDLSLIRGTNTRVSAIACAVFSDTHLPEYEVQEKRSSCDLGSWQFFSRILSSHGRIHPRVDSFPSALEEE